MAFDLNTLLNGADSGGTWSHTGGPSDLGLVPATGIINITLVGGDGGYISSPTCVDPGVYTFLYTIPICDGTPPNDTTSVSITVQDTTEVNGPLDTLYICHKDDVFTFVNPTGAVPSPVASTGSGSGYVNLPTEDYIQNCNGAPIDGVAVTYAFNPTGFYPFKLDTTNTGSSDGIDINTDDLLFDINGDPLLDTPPNLTVIDNRANCRSYYAVPSTGCIIEPITNHEGQMHISPNMKTFPDEGYTECLDDGTYPIGLFLPEAFYTWIQTIDSSPSPSSSGDPITVNSITFSNGGVPACGLFSMYLEYDIGFGWTEFNPWDPNTIVNDGGLTAADGLSETIDYRAVYRGPDNMFCVAESTVTVNSPSCCTGITADFDATGTFDFVCAGASPNLAIQANFSAGTNLNLIIPECCNYNLNDLIGTFDIEVTTYINGVATGPPTSNTNNIILLDSPLYYNFDTSTGPAYNQFQCSELEPGDEIEIIVVIDNIVITAPGCDYIGPPVLTHIATDTIYQFNIEDCCCDNPPDFTADGTFESCSGTAINTCCNGNVTCGGWVNTSLSADTYDPPVLPTSIRAASMTSSPDGGIFAGGISLNFNTLREAFGTSFEVVAGISYDISFYQCNTGTGPNASASEQSTIGDTGRWQVDFGGQTQYSPAVTFDGFGSQTWHLVNLQFTAVNTGTIDLEFTVDSTMGDNTAIYMGIDGITVFGSCP